MKMDRRKTGKVQIWSDPELLAGSRSNFLDPDYWFRIRIQHFRLNTDQHPGPIRIQSGSRVLMTKNRENFYIYFFCWNVPYRTYLFNFSKSVTYLQRPNWSASGIWNDSDNLGEKSKNYDYSSLLNHVCENTWWKNVKKFDWEARFFS